MAQCNSVNVELANSQLNKLKSVTKMKLSSNMIDDAND